MDVLVLWRDVPMPNFVSTARLYYFLKFNKKCNITLVSPIRSSVDESIIDNLKIYCKNFKLVKVPNTSKMHQKVMYALKNRISLQNLYSRNFNVFGSIYFPEVRKTVVSILRQSNFDVIYADRVMLSYVFNSIDEIPIVGDFVDPILYSLYQFFLYEMKIHKKLKWILSYYFHKLLEVPKYKNIDAGIYINEDIMKLLKPYVPKKSFVVPNGIDIEYFKPESYDTNSPFPSLVFVGAMNYPVNVNSVIYFCNKIFPLIKKEVAHVKLYIVGRSPTAEVIQLAQKYTNIIVTGEVDDVRPYLAKAHIVIAPIVVDDGGFKTKVLEAMAMGKSIVSTSIGAKGLNITPEKDVIIADNPKDFAEHVIELLHDEQLRRKIGINARKTVEKNYSWEKVIDQLIKALEGLVENERYTSRK